LSIADNFKINPAKASKTDRIIPQVRTVYYRELFKQRDDSWEISGNEGDDPCPMESIMLMKTIIPNRWHDRRNAHLPPDGRHVRRVYVPDHQGGIGSAAGGAGFR